MISPWPAEKVATKTPMPTPSATPPAPAATEWNKQDSDTELSMFFGMRGISDMPFSHALSSSPPSPAMASSAAHSATLPVRAGDRRIVKTALQHAALAVPCVSVTMARHLSREEVKAAKEAFVSGLTGTSPQEVLSTLLVGPVRGQAGGIVWRERT